MTAAGPEEVGEWSAVRDWPVYGRHMSLMHDGKVLLFSVGNDVHVWDPATDQFTPRPAAFGDLYCAGHAILADGRVMVVGGVNVSPFVGIDVAATFDPVTQSWTSVWLLDTSGSGSLTSGPTNLWTNTVGGCCTESAAMYKPGKIIRAGGGDPAHPRTSTVDMNAVNPQWQETTPMNFARRRHTLVILADGTVMSVGGTTSADDPSKAVLDTEIWDPATKTWKVAAALSKPRIL